MLVGSLAPSAEAAPCRANSQTHHWRLIAFVAVAAVVLVSCTRLGSGGFNGKPADLYAAGPSLSDVRGLFGDNNWWQGPPSFAVRPLDAATTLPTERFSITQQFIHVGTAEQLVVRYTVYDTTTSATTVMTNLKKAYGASTPPQKVGDDTLYLTGAGGGGAPYIGRIYVRLGQIMVQIGSSRKDGPPTLQLLQKVATMVIDGLKKAVAGKVHPSPKAVDQNLLPPPGLDITFLGSAQLPIETWSVMANLALPGTVATLLHGEGVDNFVYGDYALNDDTHMEIRSALLTFTSASAATDWATTFAPGTPDQSGIASAYLPVAGGTSPAAGEYHYLFISGAYGAMLVCKPTIDGEAASRACEDPMLRTAVAWKIALGG